MLMMMMLLMAAGVCSQCLQDFLTECKLTPSVEENIQQQHIVSSCVFFTDDGILPLPIRLMHTRLFLETRPFHHFLLSRPIPVWVRKKHLCNISRASSLQDTTGIGFYDIFRSTSTDCHWALVLSCQAARGCQLEADEFCKVVPQSLLTLAKVFLLRLWFPLRVFGGRLHTWGQFMSHTWPVTHPQP